VHPRFIVLEAAGGYETDLVTALATAQLPVCFVRESKLSIYGRDSNKRMYGRIKTK
jgi:hypothetical protein